MREDHKISRKAAIRMLERACRFEGKSPLLGSQQVEDAARNLGLSREALLDSMSAEMDSGWRTVLLGRTSFHARIQLGGPLGQNQLVEVMDAAGFGLGAARDLGNHVVWQRHATGQSIQVNTDGTAVLKLTAQRSPALGFVPWLGWGAGVACLAATPALWPTLEPSMAAFALAAAVGFSTARAAWNRILAGWRDDMAYCVSKLEADLSVFDTIQRGV